MYFKVIWILVLLALVNNSVPPAVSGRSLHSSWAGAGLSRPSWKHLQNEWTKGLQTTTHKCLPFAALCSNIAVLILCFSVRGKKERKA